MDKVLAAVGAASLTSFGAFWRWHTPKVEPLSKEEIDQYLEAAAKLPLPEGHMEPILARLRAWAEADDGKPCFNLNMIRFYPENRTWPGAPEFTGTPQEANAHYEKHVAPMLLKKAGYPMVGGRVLGPNMIAIQEDQAPWSTVEMVRYRSRRAFLQLLADPEYAPYEPYKFMALEIDLVPVASDTVIPDPRWLVGGTLTTVFLMTAWARAARRG